MSKRKRKNGGYRLGLKSQEEFLNLPTKNQNIVHNSLNNLASLTAGGVEELNWLDEMKLRGHLRILKDNGIQAEPNGIKNLERFIA